ncbi:hypothetical protein DRW41_03730 [Neobacillus piezotolerans]|uniref:Uncharacterized protein n=1 Tax=Neobacillus piezotolerans TaxID=2259171 RepID=A0A3D8GWX8_9BACI|nr:hypothetical protein [Neobacillus piezotolerans]RDU38681.1 hypothetical protein DRW41_03730 [Neobacillus piezotolerans]
MSPEDSMGGKIIMFIDQLVLEYRKNFGFKKTIRRNMEINKWFSLYLLSLLVLPITFLYFSSLKDEPYMLLILFIFWSVVLLGGKQHKKKLIDCKPANSFGYTIEPFLGMLRNKFGIITKEQLLIVDEIIKQEIAKEERESKYPFQEMIRQMFVAIPITGILSYAFSEIKNGNTETGNSLIGMYFFLFCCVLIMSGFLKVKKEFANTAYLSDISRKIQIALLELSVYEHSDIGKKINTLPFLPPRAAKKRGEISRDLTLLASHSYNQVEDMTDISKSTLIRAKHKQPAR